MPSRHLLRPSLGFHAVRATQGGRRRGAAVLLGLLLLLQGLPWLSQWVAAAQGGWVQVCSVSGMAWVAQPPQPGTEPVPASPEAPCVVCLLHAGQPVLPLDMQVQVPAGALAEAGIPAGSSQDEPLRAHVWRVSPRGPPLPV